jgi:hypothetical protein
MRVVVFAVERWLNIARTPKTLHDVGFEVGVLTVPGTYLAATCHADMRLLLPRVDGRRVLRALDEVVGEWGAKLLIPGDSSTLAIVHEILRRDACGGPTHLQPATVSVLRRSMAPVEYLGATTDKLAYAALCADVGVRTPEWRKAYTMADLLTFADDYGYPVVVKADETTAGNGVRICDTEDDLANAGYALLSQFTSHGRDVPTEPVLVQRFIDGASSAYSGVAWQGELLAGAAFVKVRSDPPKTGPPTVIEFVDAGESEEFVRRITQHTRYTGFAVHEYIVENGTGLSYMIECNPRPVSSHSSCIYAGVDLGAALYAAATGAPRPRFFLKPNTVIAIYPQEVIRDPESEFLKTAIQDMPEDDPGLQAAYEQFIARVKTKA